MKYLSLLMLTVCSCGGAAEQKLVKDVVADVLDCAKGVVENLTPPITQDQLTKAVEDCAAEYTKKAP